MNIFLMTVLQLALLVSADQSWHLLCELKTYWIKTVTVHLNGDNKTAEMCWGCVEGKPVSNGLQKAQADITFQGCQKLDLKRHSEIVCDHVDTGAENIHIYCYQNKRGWPVKNVSIKEKVKQNPKILIVEIVYSGNSRKSFF